MAEALIRLTSVTHADPIKDRRGCWKAGYVIDVQPDGYSWGAEEHPASHSYRPRRTALITFPGVSVARVQKYLAAQPDAQAIANGIPDAPPYRRRLWQIQSAELPAAARNKLATTGLLTIGATGDYTWAQVRNYFMRLDDSTRETEAMVVG